MGIDPVKAAATRYYPTNNPADSNSPNVFGSQNGPSNSASGGTKSTVNPPSTRDDQNKSKSSHQN